MPPGALLLKRRGPGVSFVGPGNVGFAGNEEADPWQKLQLKPALSLFAVRLGPCARQPIDSSNIGGNVGYMGKINCAPPQSIEDWSYAAPPERGDPLGTIAIEFTPGLPLSCDVRFVLDFSPLNPRTLPLWRLPGPTCTKREAAPSSSSAPRSGGPSIKGRRQGLRDQPEHRGQHFYVGHLASVQRVQACSYRAFT
ncbi:hypothetical protein GWK47_014315 [Chionoecetes opilio]|uniref:Uncharacterized protein n=1 Tax=Chionoecetes opilio TaxID=41210 RepID=A0A8J4XT70_CHIOP|nr:hypothetical protein GWK47_014315 [Chionoecetes opilio]